jgi:hypothetical protein
VTTTSQNPQDGSVKSSRDLPLSPNFVKIRGISGSVSRTFVKIRHLIKEVVLITLRDLRRNPSAITVGVKLNTKYNHITLMVRRYEIVSVVALIVLAICQWLGIILRLWTLSDVLSVIPFFIFTAMFGVFLWGLQRRLENVLGKKTTISGEESIPKYKPDPNFTQFTIHYLRTKGAPDTPDFAQLRYIANNKSRRVWRMHELPDCLAPAIKEHKISWVSYDDEKILRRNLSVDYTIYETDPTPETLGLIFKDGQWKEYSPHSKLLSSLEGRRLENLQVLTLTRKYFFSEIKRTLLIKFSEKEGKNEVWLAPSYIFELVEKGMITEENKGMRFWESCKKWCKRNGYTFIDRRYPEGALLTEGS